MHSKIKLNNREVLIIDTGCDLSPKAHYVWLGQISPTFAVVFGDSEDSAHEYMADEIGFGALDNEFICKLAEELQRDDPTLHNDEAWMNATEGMLPLNGGAEWIDNDDWGFWSPSLAEEKILKIACQTIRNIEG